MHPWKRDYESKCEKLLNTNDLLRQYLIQDGRMSTTASRRASIAAEMVQSFELNSSERVSTGVDRTESAEDIDTIRDPIETRDNTIYLRKWHLKGF